MQPPPSGAYDAPGGEQMARGLAIAAVVAALLTTSAVAGAATVDRERGARGAADHRAEAQALDDLLERSGLRVQLESLTAGIRAQFVRAHRRQSGQTQITINRIVAEHFVA